MSGTPFVRLPQFDDCKVTVAVLFGVAVATVAIRVAIRIRARRFGLDDFFLICGLFCLSGTTGLILDLVRKIFIMEVLQKDLSVVLTPDDLLGLTLSTAVIDSFFCLAWATVVCVKFSFLALFRLLIRRISRKIGIYYWVVVVFTVLAGIFLVSEAFILCSHFGSSASKWLVIYLVAHLANIQIW